MCPFKFRVWFHPGQATSGEGRWAISAYAAGNSKHCGHYHTDPSHVCRDIRSLSVSDRQLVDTLLARNVPPRLIQDIFYAKTTAQLNASNLQSIRQYAEQTRLGCNNTTSAEKLMQQLENDPKGSHMALFAEKSAGTTIVKVVKKRGTMKSTIETTDVIGVTSFVDLIHQALSVSTLKMLVAAAWVTNSSVELARAFPEVVMSDVTYKTNSEKRPLFIMVGRDSEGKVFPIMWAFLPSEERWVFEWLYKTVIPVLLGPRFCSHNRVHLTDQCAQAIEVLDLCCNTDGVYPLSQHRLCNWHKIDRGIGAIKGLSRTSAAQVKTGLAEAQHTVIQKWLYSLSGTGGVESLHEFQISMNLLHYYLSSDEVQKNTGGYGYKNAQLIKQFLRNSYVPLAHKLGKHN